MRIKPLYIATGALLLLFIRRMDAFLLPQFWAEDFAFVIDAEKRGAAAILDPRAGYLHFIPRMVAWVGSYLDPALQPPLYVGSWVALMLVVVFMCFSERLDLPAKPWLAFAILAVPHSGEVFFTPTNIQWVAALGILLTALKRDPVTAADWLLDGFFLVAAGLTGPFIIFSLVLFGARALVRRSRASWLVLGLAILPAAVQMWFVAHAPPDPEFSGPFDGLNLVAEIAYRWVGNLFLGTLVGPAVGKIFTIIVAAGLLGFLINAAIRAKKYRYEALAMVAFCVVLLASTTLRKRFDLWGFGGLTDGDRYFFIPKILLLWITGIVFSMHAGWMRWTAVALAVSSLALNVPRFRFPGYQDYHWYAACPAIRRGETITVTINPDWRFVYHRGSMESHGPLM